jgi:hypothetical protein
MRFDQFLAAEVVAGLLLLAEDEPLHHRLRGDAGVVGAGHPQGVVTLHPPPADEHVLQRVVERVAHVQGAGHVRRRDDDREGFAIRVRVAVEVAALLPEFVFDAVHQRQPRRLDDVLADADGAPDVRAVARLDDHADPGRGAGAGFTTRTL